MPTITDAEIMTLRTLAEDEGNWSLLAAIRSYTAAAEFVTERQLAESGQAWTISTRDLVAVRNAWRAELSADWARRCEETAEYERRQDRAQDSREDGPTR